MGRFGLLTVFRCFTSSTGKASSSGSGCGGSLCGSSGSTTGCESPSTISTTWNSRPKTKWHRWLCSGPSEANRHRETAPAKTIPPTLCLARSADRSARLFSSIEKHADWGGGGRGNGKRKCELQLMSLHSAHAVSFEPSQTVPGRSPKAGRSSARPVFAEGENAACHHP